MRRPAIRRIANPWSVWIAMLAIVLQAVMPMVAQARMRMAVPAVSASHEATRSAETRDDVMVMGHGMAATDDGVMSHRMAAPADPPANPHAMHGDAPCPYCRVHLDTVSLPPIPNPHWVLLVSVVPRPVTDDAVPVTVDPWSPTRPRGPPPIA